MNLFDMAREKQLKKEAPLASRMRPRILEEVIGQRHILGKDKLLYRAIKADRLTSVIFYGPPGTGKTTLAMVIANSTSSYFDQLSAVTSGIADIKKAVVDAKERLGMYGKRTILFIDEIHRFNKSQQDALLPHVEDGTIILIGATTENPYFEVNRALISRSRIFQLKLLSKEEIIELLKRTISDKDRGLGMYNVEVSEQALEHLAMICGGDCRNALNALELAVLSTECNEKGVISIDLRVAEESIQSKAIVYDKGGDNHYDVISAFIKSMRGSDPHAAVYWLAKMIEAGENPRFIARRIVICASEDVGNADPMALVIAESAARAVDFVGFPEASIILSQAVTYIASAPKSNACCNAIFAAINDVKNLEGGEVPPHLRDGHYSGAKDLGNAIGYKYPHDYEGGYVEQQYLPDNVINQKYYVPKDIGQEIRIKEYLAKVSK